MALGLLGSRGLESRLGWQQFARTFLANKLELSGPKAARFVGREMALNIGANIKRRTTMAIISWRLVALSLGRSQANPVKASQTKPTNPNFRHKLWAPLSSLGSWAVACVRLDVGPISVCASSNWDARHTHKHSH